MVLCGGKRDVNMHHMLMRILHQVLRLMALGMTYRGTYYHIVKHTAERILTDKNKLCVGSLLISKCCME